MLCSLITAMLQDMRSYHYVAVRALLGKHLIMVPDHILPRSRAVVGLQPGFELHSRPGHVAIIYGCIVHSDPPATIDPDESSTIAREHLAGFVERLIGAAVDESEHVHQED